MKSKEFLNFLEIKIDNINGNTALISVPNYRIDVKEIDITEENNEIYGYNNIEIPTKINSSISLTTLKTI